MQRPGSTGKPGRRRYSDDPADSTDKVIAILLADTRSERVGLFTVAVTLDSATESIKCYQAYKGMHRRGVEEYRRSKFYRPVKQAVSLRLDADVLAWLKKDGDGYQTGVNQMLRERMLAELNKG